MTDTDDTERSAEELRGLNREVWNQWTGVNFDSAFYDVEGFVAGWERGENPRRARFDALEAELLGDVRGQRLLHLQCHFGMDTLTQARRGAEVTGVDYSEEAIRTAQRLARTLGASARFVCSDVYDLPNVLDERFDVVFTSLGVLSWLDDLDAWARVIARCLEPGGRFVLLEAHPFAWVFDDEAVEPRFDVRYGYFDPGRPLRLDQTGVYSDPSNDLPSTTYEWTHSLSDLVGSLLRAGLVLDALDEYEELAWPMFSWMEARPDGSWSLPEDLPSLPLMLSIRAHLPESP